MIPSAPVIEVSIRDLRNKGGDVIDRVAAGEAMTVTRDGVPVAELRPLRRRGASAEELVRRWRKLPPLDVAALRSDVDSAVDPTL